MLRACRRLLVTGGRTAFFTIVVADGLSKEAHRRAVRVGPRAVAQTRPTGQLMKTAGFVDIDVVDFTREFEATARAWEREYEEHQSELEPLLGERFEELKANRRAMLGGLRDRLLRRVMVSGAAPAR